MWDAFGHLLDWVAEGVIRVARPVGIRAIGAWRRVTGRPVFPPSDVTEWFVGLGVIVAATAGLILLLAALPGEPAPSLGAGEAGAP